MSNYNFLFEIKPETMMQATIIILGCSAFAYPIKVSAMFMNKVPFKNLRGKNEYEGKLSVSYGFDFNNISIDFELNVIRLDNETFDAELITTINKTKQIRDVVKNVSLDILEVRKLFIGMYNKVRMFILNTLPAYEVLEKITKEFEGQFKRKRR
jgi:hypothetical protein